MTAPDPLDFLDVDHLLSTEERQVRDLVREWVADNVLPRIDAWFEDDEQVSGDRGIGPQNRHAIGPYPRYRSLPPC